MLRNIRRHYRRQREFREWERSGSPLPLPPAAKQRIVRLYAEAFSLETLVETGTYLGDMVEATRSRFKRIVSVELHRALYLRAAEKFARYPHVTILEGDSGELFPKLLPGLPGPCLFWLDAHYSGDGTARGTRDTPVEREMREILLRPDDGSVVLVDDARLFTGENDYPTLDGLRSLVSSSRPGLAFYVKNDVIRVHAATGASLPPL